MCGCVPVCGVVALCVWAMWCCACDVNDCVVFGFHCAFVMWCGVIVSCVACFDEVCGVCLCESGRCVTGVMCRVV